ERPLQVGGIIIFASGAGAALGSIVAPRLPEVFPERRLVAGLLIVSSLAVGALVLAHGVWGYGTLRFVQVLCIAPVFPIVVARIAHTAGGEAIGVINAARIGASFVGPVVATSLLASSSSRVLSVLLALPPGRRSTGYVFQEGALWAHMTVRGHVAFGLEQQGMAAADVERRVGLVLGRLGLAECADRRPPELDLGQRRRLALARAL